ncbi:hypothetical protein ACIBJI_24100 [Nocardia sp. NPDC050408]|uniref:hypothetical protein n=1 Tax=Nocardia sp. NPDC050408 TaxID=3364319 RepID=UPI0037AF78DD
MRSLVIVLVGLFAAFAIIDGPTFYSMDDLRVILTTQAINKVIALAVFVALIAAMTHQVRAHLRNGRPVRAHTRRSRGRSASPLGVLALSGIAIFGAIAMAAGVAMAPMATPQRRH